MVKATKSPRKSSIYDKHIGKRLVVLRSIKNLSQKDVAVDLDVSFQQVQKYESGRNRISGGRLWEISQIYKVPITWFFTDMPDAKIE